MARQASTTKTTRTASRGQLPARGRQQTSRQQNRNTAGRGARVTWSKQDEATLRRLSKSKTPVSAIATQMGRTAGALRQKAYALEIPLGHRR
jgi:hypothetical protein